MNKQRRDQLSEIVGKLEVLKDELEDNKLSRNQNIRTFLSEIQWK